MATKDDSNATFTSFLGNDENGTKIEAEAPPAGAQWINAAKVGQVVDVKSALCSITAEALEGSLGTWKGKRIFKNHETEIKGFAILDEKFENPFLSFLLHKEIVAALAKGGGGSIDGIATNITENKLCAITGVGYSVLDKDRMPACTKEAGCGVGAEGAAEKGGDNVNIAGDNPAPNINTVSGLEIDNPKKADNNKEDKKDMSDKEGKPEVVFSKEQVAEIKAAAVTDAGEQMTALHKVEIGELEKSHADELKKLGETHTTELETQRVSVQKQSALIESLGTKYALSDEAKKGLVDAKTLEDALTLFSTLKVEKAEPVVAAEGKAKGHGITLGSEVKGKAPETTKIEQVGNWNPYTNKYEPSFREELK